MDKIEELLTRGVEQVIPSKEELEKILRSGKKLRVYQGFDPTSPQLHIGHLVGLRKLRQWQDLGHEVIFLIGDFTGMVGDPSGKDKTRIPLTHDQVLENAKTYKEQVSKILRFAGENPVIIKYNGDWLSKMPAVDLAKLTHYLTVQQLLERDLFQNRLKKDMNIAFSEFLYPLMQGYDSVAMDVDVEIGGSDQLFNMMIGRDLMHKIKRKNKFVMTTPLLTDSTGKKIGKTEGNAIGLTDKPSEFFGKIMALPDDVIVKCFEYLTSLPLNQVKTITQAIEKGENPIIYKKKLAFTLVKELNNEEEARKAQEFFEKTVQKKELPQEIPTTSLPKSFVSSATVTAGIVELGLALSNSDAKRVIEQGGITINNETVRNPNIPLSSLLNGDENIIQRGKFKVVKVKIQ